MPNELLPPIDWNNPRLPRQPYGGAVGQTAGTAYNPMAEALASWGVAQGAPWGNLARMAAPGVNQAEEFARNYLGTAGEMTGIPAADRAAQAFAAGDLTRGAGEALMALPSRAAAIPGMLLSQAEAQPPDPRLKRIQDLNQEITGYRKVLEGYATKNFRSTVARQNASKPYLDGIEKAQKEAARLQKQLDDEYQAQLAQERVSARSAEWAKTPFARRYPGALEGAVGLGAAAGFALPFMRGRAAVPRFNAAVRQLDDQVMQAVNRANDARLAPRTRTQAANEARALQAQRDQLVQTGPQTGGHGRAILEGSAPVEAPLVLSQLHDYVAGASDPSGELRSQTLHANNPIENPGEFASRYGIAFGAGGALGTLGHILGDRGVDVPPGHAGVVGTLKRQYRAPRKR